MGGLVADGRATGEGNAEIRERADAGGATTGGGDDDGSCPASHDSTHRRESQGKGSLRDIGESDGCSGGEGDGVFGVVGCL